MKHTRKNTKRISLLLGSFVLASILAVICMLPRINTGMASGQALIDTALWTICITGIMSMLMTRRPRLQVIRVAYSTLGSLVLIVAVVEAIAGTLGILDGIIYALSAHLMLVKAVEASPLASQKLSADLVGTIR